MRELSVRLLGEPVGTLIQNDVGTIEFLYDQKATTPLSMSLPLQTEHFSQRSCQPYFQGLLPESEVVRALIGKKYGISPHNIFSLLESIGHECAGAVSFHQMDEAIFPKSTYSLEGREIEREELKQIILDLPKRPLFTDIDGLRLSLAGVQDKAALCYHDGRFIIPHGSCPTTHIVKTAIPAIEGSLFNEYACLKLAKHIQLPASTVELMTVDEVSFLLVERYDRSFQNGQIRRLHQEDFCQALGILPTNKYENEGGPTAAHCFSLLSHSFSAAKDRATFLRFFVFNVLIGNKDAHGKNYSFLYDQDHRPFLTPLYDALCTDFYPTLTKKMAMKIGGKYLLEEVYERHWQAFSNALEISFSQLKTLIFQIRDQIKKQLDRPDFVIEESSADMWKRLCSHIGKNMDTVCKRLEGG